MGKSLLSRLKNTALVSAGLIALAGLTGCTAPGSSDAYAVNSAVAGYNRDMATTRKGYAGWNMVSAASGALSANASRRESQPNVTVNVNTGNNQKEEKEWGYIPRDVLDDIEKRNNPPKAELPLVYTCGGTKEEIMNSAGGAEKDIGKKVFYAGEYIGLIGSSRITDGGQITNQTTHIQTGIFGKIVKKDSTKGTFQAYHVSADRLLEIMGEGDFVNVWYNNGKEIGRLNFSVYKDKASEERMKAADKK